MKDMKDQEYIPPEAIKKPAVNVYTGTQAYTFDCTVEEFENMYNGNGNYKRDATHLSCPTIPKSTLITPGIATVLKSAITGWIAFEAEIPDLKKMKEELMAKQKEEDKEANGAETEDE